METLKEQSHGIFKISLDKLVNPIAGVEQTITYYATCLVIDAGIILTTYPNSTLEQAENKFQALVSKYRHGTFEQLSDENKRRLSDLGLTH